MLSFFYKIKKTLDNYIFFCYHIQVSVWTGWVLTLGFYRNITYKVLMLLKNYKFYSYITTLDE